MYRRPNIQGHPTPYLFEYRARTQSPARDTAPKLTFGGLTSADYPRVVVTGQPAAEPAALTFGGLTSANYWAVQVTGQPAADTAQKLTFGGLTSADYSQS